MKASKTANQDQQREKMMAWLVMPINSAGTGALFGGVIGLIAGSMFVDLIGFELVWWQTAIIGLILGALFGVITAFKTVRSINEIEDALTSKGMKPLNKESIVKVRNRVRKLVSNRVNLNSCYFNSYDGIHLVIGELTIEGTRTKNSDGTEPEPLKKTQTCVYFEVEGFQFPAFEMRPERMMVRLLSTLAGGSDINFEESPIFSKQYFLESDAPEDIRKLFNLELRQTFENNPGFQVVAQGRQVILFKPNKKCRKREYDSFVNIGLQILAALQHSAVQFQDEKPKNN